MNSDLKYYRNFFSKKKKFVKPAIKIVPKLDVDDTVERYDDMMIDMDKFDPTKLLFNKNVEKKLLLLKYDNQPTFIRTDEITLSETPFLKDGTMILYSKDRSLDKLFEMFKKMDKFIVDNRDLIISGYGDNLLNKYSMYVPCVRDSEKYGQYVKLRLPMVFEEMKRYAKIHYRNGLEGKIVKKLHPLTSLNYIMRAGKKIKFIFRIDKIWYNHDRFGYGINIVQVEIDDSAREKAKYKNSADSVTADQRMKFGLNHIQKKQENYTIIDKLSNASFVPTEEIDFDEPI